MANFLTFGIFQKQQVLAVWCVVISHNRQRRFQEMKRCPIILVIYRYMYSGIWHIQCFHTRYVIKYQPIVMQIMFPFTQYHRSFCFYDINVGCLDIIELKVLKSNSSEFNFVYIYVSWSLLWSFETWHLLLSTLFNFPFIF